jgi:hypothetical protein
VASLTHAHVRDRRNLFGLLAVLIVLESEAVLVGRRPRMNWRAHAADSNVEWAIQVPEALEVVADSSASAKLKGLLSKSSSSPVVRRQCVLRST